MRLPKSAVELAVGRWFDDNKAQLVAELLPAVVAAVKVEIRAAIRAGKFQQKRKKRA